MGKQEIFKKILDKGKTIKELASDILVDDFVKGFPNLKEDKVTYGVNVRLSKDAGSEVLPFSFIHPPLKNKETLQNIAEKVPTGLKIPDFLKLFSIEEAVFRADFRFENNEPIITEIKSVNFINPWCTFNPYKNNKVNTEGMENRFLTEFFAPNKNTFLHVNIKALGLEDELVDRYVYVWVRGQDPDVSINSDCSYLTNILAIVHKESKLLEDFIKKHKTDILEFIMLLKSRKTDDSDIKQRREAIKSAKAAIMSRNMSHNLGSHVMSYLKQHLGSVREMLKSNVLSQLVKDENYVRAWLTLTNEHDISKTETILRELIKKSTQVTSTNDSAQEKTVKESTQDTAENVESHESSKKGDPIDSVALPFLVGLGQFISYLQERQDFIATIATGYVPYFSTINFKDSVYDELNNDKRYERHSDRQNMKPDNILLGNIARSEGLGRETCPTSSNESTTLGDIVLKFRSSFTGDPVEKIDAKPGTKGVDPLTYYDNDPDKVDKALCELNEMRKYNISLPGGVVGRQAVFSIIENTIRNAAKHGNWREKGKLELSIDILEKKDILIKEINGRKLFYRKMSQSEDFIELKDDTTNAGHLSFGEVLDTFYLHSDNANDIYIVTITDNLFFSEDNLAKLRKAIAEDYVNSRGEMIETNKGIKEMRISAAWLRSINDEKQKSPIIEDKNNEEISLEDLKYDRKWLSQSKKAPILYSRISDGHLQYIFCLNKPQKVALISASFKDKVKGTDIFIENGWKLFTPQEFIENNNNNFDYVIFDNSSRKNRFKDLKNVRRHSSSLFFKLLQVDKIMDPIMKAIIGKGKKDDEDSKITKDLLDKAYNELGKKLADWDGEEMILVNDDRALSNFNQKNKDEEKQKLSQMITFKDNSKARYRYVTHLESKNEFEFYVVNSSNADMFLFSEGITGNNSTDRLLRNETLNEEWFYKHLYVMKQKVAIFDERLFSKAFGLEETDFCIPTIADFKDNLDADKAIIKKLFPGKDDEIDDLSDVESLIQYLNVEHNYDPQKGKDKEKVDSICHLGATYAAKGLFVFSIVRSCENPNEFNLYGYEFNSQNKEAFSDCKRYAVFSWDKKNKRLNIEPIKDNNSQIQIPKILCDYNFISIHQGLLDKMYEAFEIKGDEQAKENLTRDFYVYFVKCSNDSKQKVGKQVKYIKFSTKGSNITHYFLPGMTIHSGRSKPGEHDMPQQLPFIPYSAIEHAVMDCKYALVKLLNTARYE